VLDHFNNTSLTFDSDPKAKIGKTKVRKNSILGLIKMKFIKILILSLLLTSCSQAYYSAMEKFGVEKRDILISRVESAKGEQEKAKKQFESSLEEFSELVNFDGGDLEDKYKTVKSEYESSESRASAVTKRVDSVEKVATDLFKEWESELSQYSNASLRTKSRKKLVQTQTRYKPLIAAMRNAEQKMTPVLRVFKDQVLFLKHNLNAKAVASLKTELGDIQREVAGLVREMNTSIEQADRFIDGMQDS